MSQSYESKLIDDVATLIRQSAGHLNSTLPQAALALNNLAISVGHAGESYEQYRVASIIDGTHPALTPIKHMLHLQSRDNDASSPYLINNLALQELVCDHIDEMRLQKPSKNRVDHKKLFSRFVGAWYRRIYLTRGVEDNCGASSLFSNVTRKDVPYGKTIKDGNIVVQFKDAAKSFEHTLTLGKHYLNFDSNKYHIHSLWMNEEFSGIFEKIGWMWLQQYLMAPVCVSHGLTLSDFQAIPNEEMNEMVKAIDDINTLNSWNTTTLYYPGDGREYLPKCRVTATYHYYSGSDDHKIIIKVIPEDNLISLGLDGSPQRREVMFENAPTPIQKWIKENIEAGIVATIAEVKAENFNH